MSIMYYNVDKNLNLIKSYDKKFTKDQLISFLKNDINKTNLNIVEIKKLSHSLVDINLMHNGESIKLYTLFKNITGAGWENKPKIKRVQVSNLKIENPENLIYQSNDTVNLTLGYYNYDDNPIYVAWDSYRYLEHNTLRSCYVSVDTLKLGYKKGYYVGVDSGQKLWVFTAENIERFIVDYIQYIKAMNRRGD